METWVLVRGKGDGPLGFRERKGMETLALVKGKGVDFLITGRGKGLKPGH
jgi:hypothetical protein